MKYWILAKYRYVGTNYNMECDPVYMDEKYSYSIDESVEAPLEEDNWIDFGNDRQKQLKYVPTNH